MESRKRQEWGLLWRAEAAAEAGGPVFSAQKTRDRGGLWDSWVVGCGEGACEAVAVAAGHVRGRLGHSLQGRD